MAIEREGYVDKHSGIEKYGSGADFADKKNHKYPLDTKEHVETAARYWGKQEDKDKYVEGRNTISNKIHAAERKFGIK